MITRQEVKEIYEDTGKFSFEMEEYWMNCNVEYLNDLIDEYVEDGYLLGEIDYEPIGVSGGCIKFLVTVGDMSDYFEDSED